MNIPDEAIEAAARVVYRTSGRKRVMPYSEARDACRDEALETLEAAAPHLMADAAALIRELTDPEDCSFDHHGGCQAHGYLSLKPGETCPQADAKAWSAGAGE